MLLHEAYLTGGICSAPIGGLVEVLNPMESQEHASLPDPHMEAAGFLGPSMPLNALSAVLESFVFGH